MLRAGLQKTSLVNYPGKVAAAVFLPGCNLRCPYCYNAALALADPARGPAPSPQGADTGETYFTEEEIFRHLERRSALLGGVAISGGEPLISPFLEPLILKAKSLGLAVKIDTNGTFPERLRRLIGDGRLRPDMVALDVKTAPGKYSLLLPSSSGKSLGDAVVKSINILAEASRERLVAVEYRTVLVPGLAGKAEAEEIAALLPHDADWKLAAFAPARCLDPAWSEKAPYSGEEMEEIIAAAREKVPAAELR